MVKALAPQRGCSLRVLEIGLVVSLSVLPPEQPLVVGITLVLVWNNKRAPAFFYTGAFLPLSVLFGVAYPYYPRVFLRLFPSLGLVTMGARGLEPPNLTDVNRAL